MLNEEEFFAAFSFLHKSNIFYSQAFGSVVRKLDDLEIARMLSNPQGSSFPNSQGEVCLDGFTRCTSNSD